MSQNYKKPNHVNLIFDHLQRCSKLISMDLENVDINSLENYFARVRMSLLSLNALVAPFKDEEFEEPELSKDQRSERGSNRPTLENQIEYVEEFLTEITNLLKRKNLVYYEYKEPAFGRSANETD